MRVRQKETPPTKYPLKVQAIRSGKQQARLYVYFPLPLAAAIGLNAGEQVSWELLDRGELHLVREKPPAPLAQEHSAGPTKTTRKENRLAAGQPILYLP